MTNTKTQFTLVACLLVVALVIIFTPQQCLAGFMDPVAPADYTGSLNAGTGGGLTASDGWISEDTVISWTVTNNGSSYHYEYKFRVPVGGKELSHSIIQVSDNFGTAEEDYVNATLNLADLAAFLGTYSGSGDDKPNPGFPDTISIKGLKFENVTEGEDFPDDGDGLANTWTWSFDSLRAPMWGHFYAVDGWNVDMYVYAFNTGLVGGSDFIVVPDTTVVPIPPAVLLGMFGMGVAGIKLRKYA